MKVFLDSSILFAASYSQTGGSTAIINLAKKGKLLLFSSRFAIKEAERNLSKKAKEHHLDRFYQILEEVKITLVDVKRDLAKKTFGKMTGEKDAPILAAAIKSKANFLLTFDRKHLLTPKVKRKSFPIIVLTPEELIKKYL